MKIAIVVVVAFSLFFRCGHCNLFYDAVFKLEDLDLELRFLGEALNLGKSERIMEAATRPKDRAKEVEQRRREYFKELSGHQIDTLKRIYSRDFKLFDYSMDGYGNSDTIA